MEKKIMCFNYNGKRKEIISEFTFEVSLIVKFSHKGINKKKARGFTFRNILADFVMSYVLNSNIFI